MTVTDNDVNDFLAHYGVKGMRWGVRNDRRATDSNGTVSGLTPAKVVLAAYGAIFVSAILAQRAAIYKDSGRKDAKKTGDKSFKKNPALAQKMSVDNLHNKVVKPINPGYGKPGTKANCRRATMAYEMRRRGYDVKATHSMYASGQGTKGLNTATNTKRKDLESIWGEKVISDKKTFIKDTPQQKADAVFKALSSNQNGARGEIGLQWQFGGGHSMAWEIVNNKPVIFDTQNGKKYASPKEFASFTPTVVSVSQTRLDNKTINDDFLKRWVTDV